jgi:hypothetical protein
VKPAPGGIENGPPRGWSNVMRCSRPAVIVLGRRAAEGGRERRARRLREALQDDHVAFRLGRERDPGDVEEVESGGPDAVGGVEQVEHVPEPDHHLLVLIVVAAGKRVAEPDATQRRDDRVVEHPATPQGVDRGGDAVGGLLCARPAPNARRIGCVVALRDPRGVVKSNPPSRRTASASAGSSASAASRGGAPRDAA